MEIPSSRLQHGPELAVTRHLAMRVGQGMEEVEFVDRKWLSVLNTWMMEFYIMITLFLQPNSSSLPNSNYVTSYKNL